MFQALFVKIDDNGERPTRKKTINWDGGEKGNSNLILIFVNTILTSALRASCKIQAENWQVVLVSVNSV